MKNFKLFLIGILLFSSFSMFAQQTVKGVVKEKTTGEPLPGVSVVVKGTTRGTETDFNGNFTIEKVNTGDVLVFKYLGYADKEVAIGSSLNITVELDESSEQLDEIVNSDLKVSAKRVARSDLELLTLSGDNNSYASFKLSALKNDQVDQGNMHSSMKEYFYEKYSTDEKEKEALTRSSGESSINKLLNLEPNY